MMVKKLLLLVIFLALIVSAGMPAAGAPSLLLYGVYLPLVRKDNANPVHNGTATWYDADGDGACMFGESPDDLLVAAMNHVEYEDADYCGAFLRVTGPEGSVLVRVVDLCPDPICGAGHLDLSYQAFDAVANPDQGYIPISWQVVSPEISGPIAYHFKDGSNEWWTAVQVRNHRNPIASLEYWNGSGWVNVPRTGYNYFVEAAGMGPGPYSFRVTDWYGSILVDSGIPHIENGMVEGAGQFPYGP
jgi:expansin (peptidoglycan-binding protein)